MHVKCILRFSALPKRWIRVTAPVCAMGFVKPALRVRCVAMARWTMPSTFPMTAGLLANRKRSERKTKHPLAHGLIRQNFINQQCSAVGHASCPTTGTETALLATECNQFFIVAGFAPHPQKAMLKPSAFQVLIEFFNDVSRKVLAMTGQFRLKLRPVLLNDLVKQGRLGPVAHIDPSRSGRYLRVFLREQSRGPDKYLEYSPVLLRRTMASFPMCCG